MSGHGVRSILRNSAYVFAGQGVTLGVKLLYMLVLAGLLGPSLYGQYNYAIAWYTVLLPFTLLGFPLLLSREIGADRSRAEKLLPQTLLLRSLAAILFALLSALLAAAIETDAELRMLLYIVSATLVFRAVALWSGSVFSAYEASQWGFRYDAIFRTFEALVGVVVAVATRDIFWLALVHMVSWLFHAVRSVAVVASRFSSLSFSVGLLRDAGDVLRTGIPIGLVAVCLTWVLQVPVLVGRFTMGDAAVLGQMVLALQILTYMTIVPQSLAVAAVPVLSRAAARQDGKGQIFLDLTIRGSIIFGTVVGLLAAGFGEMAVRWLFGEQYSSAGQLVEPLMWAVGPLAIVTISTQALMAAGHVWSVVGISLAAIGVYTSVVVFAMMVGTQQLSWVVSAGLSVYALALLGLARVKIGISLSFTLLRPLLLSLASAGVYYTLRDDVNAYGVVPAFLLLGLGVVSFVARQEFQFLLRRLSSRER